jgi:hypothetical protein
MLIVGRSSGRPSKLLRRVSVTNSSISLPVWSVIPIAMDPAASSGVSCPAVPPSLNAGGLRKPESNGMLFSDPSAFVRAIVSVSIECPNR